jgi:glycosyltransferase involved in cell wall biosynthesis
MPYRPLASRLAARRGFGSARPKVTVVVPLFDKAPFVQECLDSIAAQTIDGLEVVCVDDASTDGSLELVRAHARRDRRVRVVRHTTHRGAAEARNTGLREATGDFVQFTDADDRLPLDAIQRLWDLATADQVPVVRGALGNFDASGQSWIEQAHAIEDRHRIMLREEPRLWVPYFHVCYLFSRAFLLQNAIRYPTLENGEDPVFLAQCLTRTSRLSVTSAVTYWYRRVQRPTPTLVNALHFIEHVRRVRDIYLASSDARCWTDGAASFYLEDVAHLLSRMQLSPGDGAELRTALAGVWPRADDLALTGVDAR